MNELFRSLPSVSKLLEMVNDYANTQTALDTHSPNPIEACSPALLTVIVGEYLTTVRDQIKRKEITSVRELNIENLFPALLSHVYNTLKPHLQKIINGTGVVIHTNLGRSLLPLSALQALQLAATEYTNLEFDLSTGERGSRHDVIKSYIRRLTTAEDAIVVNNNAAAVLLVLNSFVSGGEVIISRGQLVEIGGSFRIPEVMAHSGAVLREVGTTNRTHKNDYINAINENTKAIMRVHTSNFRIIGFHSDVEVSELAEIAHVHDLPLIEDLGSGSFIDFSEFNLPKEPTVQEVIAQGADIVTFSGDKLLGGPQAGIIAGKKKYIDILRNNHLLRALRPCKLTLAALEATLALYLNPETVVSHIPTLRMIAMDSEELQKRSQRLLNMFLASINNSKADFALKEDSSRVGGGAFPECPLPTTLVQVFPLKITVDALKNKLLSLSPPLLGRIEDNAFTLDVRTMPDSEFDTVTRLLNEAL